MAEILAGGSWTPELDRPRYQGGRADPELQALLLARLQEIRRKREPWNYRPKPLQPVGRDHRRRGLPAGSRPLLTRDQAIAARRLMVQVGVAEAARRHHVARPTLETAWMRYGIPRDRRGKRPRA